MLKIKHNTRDTLEFSVAPLGLWLFGSIFAIVGLLVTILLAESVTIYCDRQAQPEPSCEIRSTRVWSSDVKSFPINKIVQADIESNYSSDGGETYRNVLLVDKSALIKRNSETSELARPIQIPLSTVYSSGYESHVDVANQINFFLEDANQSAFEMQVSSAWFIVLFGGAFFAAGAAVILLSPVTACRMDRFARTIVFERRRLWGKSVQEAPLDDVIGPRLDVSRSSRGSDTMRIGIELERAETLWFGVGYDNINNKQKYQISDLVSDFLSR